MARARCGLHCIIPLKHLRSPPRSARVRRADGGFPSRRGTNVRLARGGHRVPWRALAGRRTPGEQPGPYSRDLSSASRPCHSACNEHGVAAVLGAADKMATRPVFKAWLIARISLDADRSTCHPRPNGLYAYGSKSSVLAPSETHRLKICSTHEKETRQWPHFRSTSLTRRAL